ncbi:MAG: cell division protein FtsQ [Gammaproteobacteria bacterium]|jgi:cell division protein FtsQ
MNAQVMTNSMAEEKFSMEDEQTVSTVRPMSRPVFSLLFILLIFVLCAFGSSRLMDPATLPIRHVRIEGNFQHLSTEKMQSMVSSVIRGGFFNLNVMNIKETLLREPWVDSVIVQRVWPDGLNVYVKEQSAIAHWNKNDLLNVSAHIFSPENAGQIGGLPELFGPAYTQTLLLERYREIEKALTPFAITIQSLTLSERRAWQIQLQDGPLILLGRNDVDSRIGRFTQSAITSLADEIKNVKQIDMRYTNGFAIQWLGDSEKPIESGLENNG